MLLFTFMPNFVENGWKTKTVLQIQNPGSTTTLSAHPSGGKKSKRYRETCAKMYILYSKN